ncbi:hypothetical protein BJ986_000053 [Phycicoccus badiiscoriae]|uniref:Uncharacterized protein n=1 Tax=Pedococcus badiiscoriae TaxID=642776 RepID=A0A852WJ43_9MICO|nr:hypothetical protein [Pedococcus badiiscoriae]NYG05566.1 hypothetical protein [Pedococcus badiiscoriae]
MTGRHSRVMSPAAHWRRYATIRLEQTGHFHAMPGWWKTMVLVGAVLTGLGFGQLQDGLLPGVVTLLAGIALTIYMMWLRRRAGGRGLIRF